MRFSRTLPRLYNPETVRRQILDQAHGPSLSVIVSDAQKRLRGQPPTVIFDNMSMTPAHLLNLAVEPHIPPACQPHIFRVHSRQHDCNSPFLSRDPAAREMQPGHHLVYFPPHARPSALLPDGTLRAHWPGTPFERRLWMGGEVNFKHGWQRAMRLDAGGAWCIETIDGVYGREGANGDSAADRVYVDVRRRYGAMTSWNRHASRHVWKNGQLPPDWCEKSVIDETRRLVFMKKGKPNPDADKKTCAAKAARQEGPSSTSRTKPSTVSTSRLRQTLSEQQDDDADKPPDGNDDTDAHFRFRMTPDRTLLFHFSALTHNAHAIHLDTQWTREVEGHRNLLVHGPLTQLLLLSGLQKARFIGHHVRSLRYRNTRPLYMNEELHVCVRLRGSEPAMRALLNGWRNVAPGQRVQRSSALLQESEETVPERPGEALMKWDAWIEDAEGNIAVKARAETVRLTDFYRSDRQ